MLHIGLKVDQSLVSQHRTAAEFPLWQSSTQYFLQILQSFHHPNLGLAYHSGITHQVFSDGQSFLAMCGSFHGETGAALGAWVYLIGKHSKTLPNL